MLGSYSNEVEPMSIVTFCKRKQDLITKFMQAHVRQPKIVLVDEVNFIAIFKACSCVCFLLNSCLANPTAKGGNLATWR